MVICLTTSSVTTLEEGLIRDLMEVRDSQSAILNLLPVLSPPTEAVVAPNVPTGFSIPLLLGAAYLLLS